MTDAAIRTQRPGRARTLSCPNCGSPVTIRANGLSITAVCGSCGAVLDVANDAVRQIAEAQARTRQPAISIGSRGTLGGTEWEVVGYQERSSGAGSWRWEEYLLFNPYRGFRFLGQDHGHWTLYGMLRRDVDDPLADGGDGLRYQISDTVLARTDYVLGEFYWRVRAGDTVDVREFVHPPFVLSEERSTEEVTWSRGRYLEPRLVQAAFKLGRLPPPTGHAGHQAESKRRVLWPVAVASVIGLAILNQMPVGQGLNTIVLRQSFTINSADNDRTLPAVPLAIPYARGNLQIQVDSDTDAGLLQLDVSLVPQAGLDRRQDATFTLGSLVGNGTKSQTALFSAAAGGTASLLIRPHVSALPSTVMPGDAAQPAPPPPVSFLVTVRRHVHDPVSFVLAMVAVLCWPVISALWRWFRRSGQHKA
ncbi:MAG: DUF4178 domain-containing protein [Janthinobacterium lividum]